MGQPLLCWQCLQSAGFASFQFVMGTEFFAVPNEMVVNSVFIFVFFCVCFYLSTLSFK